VNYYIDIEVKPDDEMRENVLLNKTFTKLHKTLHDQKQTAIGISFPDYKVKLGTVIRLHGDKASLETLQQTNWLGGLSGYCEVTDILPVLKKLKVTE
jgi:CRISPR-associated endonuclease Csy4